MNTPSSLLTIIDDFFDKETLKAVSILVLKSRDRQRIVSNPRITDYIYRKCEDKFRSIGITGLQPHITITKNNMPIGKHVDSYLPGVTHKILIYLSNVPDGGTIFYVDGQPHLVENKVNRMVLFDIRLEHESQKFSPKLLKIAIGFRPIFS